MQQLEDEEAKELTLKEEIDSDDKEPEESNSLLDQQYLISPKEEQDPARNGLVRMLFVGGFVGLFLFAGLALYNLFSGKPKEALLPKIVEEAPSKDLKAKEENDQLKAELALRGQKLKQHESKEELSLRKPVYDSQKQQRQQQKPTIKQSVPQTNKTVSTNSQTTPKKIVDPFTTWNRLSNLGLVTTDVPEGEKTISQEQSDTDIPSKLAPPSLTQVTGEKIATNTQSSLLKEIVIGQASTFKASSTGRYGILNRTNTVESTDLNSTIKQIPIGTVLKGEIIVPMISCLSIKDSNNTKSAAIDTDGKFVIKLLSDLKGEDMNVILPMGTMFVVNAKSISQSNGFVDAEVIAVVYPDSQGQNIQQQIPAGAIIALGEELEPLTAEGSFDPGGEIASNDILLAAVGSLAKVGEIMNQPKSFSQVNSAFGSSVTTTSDPNLLGAVLNGFFQPISTNISNRSEDVIKELQKRETVAVLPVGKQVALIIKGFVKVSK